MTKPKPPRSTRTKTTKKTTTVAKRHQPNGRGALNVGGTPGNKGGTGRPASELRARLVGTFAERVPVIEEIADGRPTQRMDVSLLTLLQYATCPKCGDALKATISPADAVLTRIEVQVSASPSDRLKALDLAGKYGIGKEETLTIVSPDVVARLERQVAVILSRAEWPSEALLNALDEVWA